MVKQPQQTAGFHRRPASDFRDRLAIFDGDAAFDDRASSAASAPGLVSVGFLRSALRRHVRFWGALALVGLVIGTGYAVKHPPEYKASTTLVLVDKAQSDPTSAITTDISLVQSTPVAAAAVSQLGLNQTPASFLHTYTVAQVTTSILSITASGPSPSAAVQRASVIAAQYLAYRAKYEQAVQQQSEAILQQQVTQAQQQLNAVTAQLAQAQGNQAEVTKLQAQQTAAVNNLGSVKQNVTATLVSTRATTQQMIAGSQVVSPATAGARPVKKTLAIYGLGGLLAGLAIGMVIVIIGAVVSDRLRRRDDIAYAIEAPVGLSVRALRSGRLPHLRGRAARQRDMDRVVEYLHYSVPGRSKGASGLAVIAVDDAPTVAQAVVALAIAESKQQSRIVLADLSAGIPAARQLGVRNPGISTVSPAGVPITVAVPARGEIAPVGPLGAASEQFAAAFADADLVLSLITLDPAVGGDYLATWATKAVAVVTAGQSTATRIRAVGEMVRLSGADLESVIVVDADRADESLGALSGKR